MKRIFYFIAICFIFSCNYSFDRGNLEDVLEYEKTYINVIADKDIDISVIEDNKTKVLDSFICDNSLYIHIFTEDNVEDVLVRLKSRNDIIIAEKDYVRELFSEPVTYSNTLNDKFVETLQYSYRTTNLGQSLEENGIGANDVFVGVIDTGINTNHPEISDVFEIGWSAFNQESPGVYSFIEGIDDDENDTDYIEIEAGEVWDGNPGEFHGGFVSAIICGKGNNEEGITGVSPVNTKLLVFKGFAKNSSGLYVSGSGSVWATYGAALRHLYGEDGTEDGGSWKAKNCPDMVLPINLSFGGPGISYFEANVISKLQSIDVLFVAASGNGHSNDFIFPASYPGVISVGAVDGDNKRAKFSTYSNNLSVVAPGVDIISMVGDDSYMLSSGTSFAAPFVTGLIANMLTHNKYLKINHIKQIIEDSAMDINTTGYDIFTGYGVVDVKKSVDVAKAYDEVAYTANERYTDKKLVVTLTNNGEALKGEAVYLYENDVLKFVATTDINGIAKFNYLEKIEYEVVASPDGNVTLEDGTSSKKIVNMDSTADVNIAMEFAY